MTNDLEKKTIYFSIPNEDGSFNMSHSKLTKENMCFYKINFAENSNNGELEFISGENDRRAINRLDAYIKPVCSMENYENRENASKVKLIESGEVYLSGENWNINPNKKVKVRFE